jgi:MFS family permease
MNRLLSGTIFGFFKSLLAGFAIILLPIYFSNMNISLITYALLLSIADVFSFIMKPVIGFISDKYGERNLLLTGTFFYVTSIFLIGQTDSVIHITFLQIIAGITHAFLLSVIIIFALRDVKENPDSKVGFFGGTGSIGWVFGLLIPGFLISTLGIKFAFYAYLFFGMIFFIMVFKFSKIYRIRSVTKFSPNFLKRIPKPLIFKTIDMAVFNGFVIFFVRYAIKNLGLSTSMVSVLIAFECLVFALSEIFIGRISKSSRRFYWIPIGMFMQIFAIYFMFNGHLLTYFLAAGLIGIGGSFIDIWVYSYISEKVRKMDKGKVIGTVSWSYDFGTILGAQVPALFSFIIINPFTSLVIFPVTGLIIFLASENKKIR